MATAPRSCSTSRCGSASKTSGCRACVCVRKRMRSGGNGASLQPTSNPPATSTSHRRCRWN
eukprot:3719511-Prymnesium_polylepis.1